MDSARTEEDFLRLIALSLRIPFEPGISVQTVEDALFAHQDCLYHMDNLEQVAEIARPLLDRWLRHCPDITFLVTSRVALGLEGERVVPVPRLSPRAAASLFSERCRVSELDPVLVRSLVDATEGIPLAVELSAGAAGILSLEDVEAGLRERPEAVLGSAFSDSIGRSVELLGRDGFDLLCQTVAFSGAFRLTDAERMVSSQSLARPDLVLEHFDRAVALGLLRVTEVGWATPYMAVAAYCERLNPTGVARGRAAHCRGVSEMMERFLADDASWGDIEEAQLCYLEREYATAIHWFLAAASELPPEDRHRVAACLGALATNPNSPVSIDPSVLGVCADRVELDEAAQVFLRMRRTRCALVQGRLIDAHALALIDKDCPCLLADPVLHARWSAQLALAEVYAGDASRVRSALETAMEVNDSEAIRAAYVACGVGAMISGEHEEAARIFRESAAQLVGRGEERWASRMLFVGVLQLAGAGHAPLAAACFDAAILYEKFFTPSLLALRFTAEGHLLLVSQQYGASALAMERAATVGIRHQGRVPDGTSTLAMGIAWFLAGRLVEAARALGDSLSGMGPGHRNLPQCHGWLAMLACERGDEAQARLHAAGAIAEPHFTGAECQVLASMHEVVEATFEGGELGEVRKRALALLPHLEGPKLATSLLCEWMGLVERGARNPQASPLLLDHRLRMVSYRGVKLECERRPLLWALLHSLTAGEVSSPIPRDTLIACLWPDDRASASSLRNRLRVSVAAVRRHLGSDVIQSMEGGYVINGAVSIEHRDRPAQVRGAERH